MFYYQYIFHKSVESIRYVLNCGVNDILEFVPENNVEKRMVDIKKKLESNELHHAICMIANKLCSVVDICTDWYSVKKKYKLNSDKL